MSELQEQRNRLDLPYVPLLGQSVNGAMYNVLYGCHFPHLPTNPHTLSIPHPPTHSPSPIHLYTHSPSPIHPHTLSIPHPPTHSPSPIHLYTHSPSTIHPHPPSHTLHPPSTLTLFPSTIPLSPATSVYRQFGLDQPLVVQLLEQLPNAKRCSHYHFLYHMPEKRLPWRTAVSGSRVLRLRAAVLAILLSPSSSSSNSLSLPSSLSLSSLLCRECHSTGQAQPELKATTGETLVLKTLNYMYNSQIFIFIFCFVSLQCSFTSGHVQLSDL